MLRFVPEKFVVGSHVIAAILGQITTDKSFKANNPKFGYSIGENVIVLKVAFTDCKYDKQIVGSIKGLCLFILFVF